MTLLGTRVGHHACRRVSATAWYHKKRPTFSDTLAAVRRQVWCDQGLLTFRHSSELAKLQPALRDGVVHALCHAASMAKLKLTHKTLSGQQCSCTSAKHLASTSAKHLASSINDERLTNS